MTFFGRLQQMAQGFLLQIHLLSGLYGSWSREFDPGSQIRARMQRGGHGCSVEGTWVGRTMEPAGPADGNKKNKSLRDLFFLLLLVF